MRFPSSSSEDDKLECRDGSPNTNSGGAPSTSWMHNRTHNPNTSKYPSRQRVEGETSAHQVSPPRITWESERG